MTETSSAPNGESHSEKNLQSKPGDVKDTKREASWPAVLFFIQIHAMGLFGLYLALTEAKLITVLYMIILVICGIIGTTVGAHRLWTHRSYTATLSLRIFLMLCQLQAGQGSIYNWVRDHRLHHKTFNTEDDPYFSTTGFVDAQFKAHLLKLSPKQEKIQAEVGMEDVKLDGVVMFQKKFYWPMYLILFVLLPMNAPAEYWNESIVCSVFLIGCLRYVLVLHATWLVNSATHVWSLKKGEKYPDDSNMVFLITKSYWNLYHYILPWDYQSGEYGSYGSGSTTTLIRIWATLGWASHLRTMDSSAVKQALTISVDTGRPIEECMEETGKDALLHLHPEHYMQELRNNSL